MYGKILRIKTLAVAVIAYAVAFLRYTFVSARESLYRRRGTVLGIPKKHIAAAGVLGVVLAVTMAGLLITANAAGGNSRPYTPQPSPAQVVANHANPDNGVSNDSRTAVGQATGNDVVPNESSALYNLIGIDASQPLEIIALLTIISVAPSILLMMTSYLRLIIVFGFLRNAMQTPTTPPNQVLASLALFLTIFIMWPVFSQINTVAYQPYASGEITTVQALQRAGGPLKEFMLKQTRNDDMSFFLSLAKRTIYVTTGDLADIGNIPAATAATSDTAVTAGTSADTAEPPSTSIEGTSMPPVGAVSGANGIEPPAFSDSVAGVTNAPVSRGAVSADFPQVNIVPLANANATNTQVPTNTQNTQVPTNPTNTAQGATEPPAVTTAPGGAIPVTDFTNVKLLDYKDQIGFEVAIPAFMISELTRAFQMGFLLFIPFLVIDIVVSCSLMAMGMMMLPPAMISLPFKIMLFVLVDGWQLLISSSIGSFNY